MSFPIKIKKILIIVGAVAAVYYGYHAFMPHGGGWGQGGAAPVNAAQVVERRIRGWHEFSGHLVAVDQVDVRPRVSGTIESVHFTDGAMVEKDNVLFTIDPRPFSAEVTRTEGLLASADAQLVLTKSELERSEKLIKQKAIPQHEYDQHRNDFNVAEANVKSAQAAVDVAKLNYDYALVKAPISGRVSRAEITTGNLVEAGNNAPVLTTIVASNAIYADFEIDEAMFLEYAHAGITGNNDVQNIPVKMSLNGESDFSHSGHIESFDNRLNGTSGTIRVRAIFENKDNVLVPGLFARIKLGGAAETDALLITDRAIGTDQSKKFVLVVGPDNKVEHREIKIDGITDDGLRIVTDGLKAGDKIIVSGLQRVMMPGQPVTPDMVDMDAKESELPAGGKPPEKPNKKKQGGS